MYLSRIKLDTNKRQTQIALISPNKIHGAIESAFSERQNRNLWRVDQVAGDSYLLILSNDKPNLLAITKQFGFSGDAGESRNYDSLLERIVKDSQWQFRLVANPTYSKKTEDGRGKITAHVSKKHQMEWLQQKAERNGFSLVVGTTELTGATWKSFKKKNAGKDVRIKEASFEGILQVDAPDKFKQALINGIGREKAYGMGLLTVMQCSEK